MDKFQNKYRIPSARAQWWGYTNPGAYFITICIEGRHHYFGEIRNGVMELSNLGVIADILWHEIPNYSKNVKLGAFVVMPNHIHGMLILPESTTVETLRATPLRWSPPKNEQMASISPKPNSVSTIVRSYKSAVTKHANRLGLPNGWQARFHDHIIRDDASYQRINDYIENNPKNWKEDRFFKGKDEWEKIRIEKRN